MFYFYYFVSFYAILSAFLFYRFCQCFYLFLLWKDFQKRFTHTCFYFFFSQERFPKLFYHTLWSSLFLLQKYFYSNSVYALFLGLYFLIILFSLVFSLTGFIYCSNTDYYNFKKYVLIFIYYLLICINNFLKLLEDSIIFIIKSRSNK